MKQARIRLESKRIADLAPADYNPRTITPEALAGLGQSLERFGLLQPIIWNRATGRIVGGHQRAKALAAQGVETTDVVVVDLPEAEEKALNVALNSEAISGDWTEGALGLLAEIERDLPDLSGSLLMPDLRDHIEALHAKGREVDDDDPAPEPPANPITKPGDLWVLGRHRLLCGDAESPEHVARLLDGKVPFLMVTDPPYGVDYSPEWRQGLGWAPVKATGVVANDHRADWFSAWWLFPGDVAYVWHGALHAGVVEASLLAARFQVRAQLIWAKQNAPISRGAYRWQHEPCWYAVRKGASAGWTGGHAETTLWEIRNLNTVGGRSDDALDVTTGHGTQKPVECMARPMRLHGHAGDLVYDPFVGSGTSIVAAERLDRCAFGLDLDPAYCDVVVARWEALTGKKAQRIGGAP